MVQTVAVIGAGAAGLTAVKCCLDEGLQPTCFEMSDDIGGLWHYKEEVEKDRTTVTKNTIANSSKEITAFSDFPPPAEFPIYMHHTHLKEYLCMYADKFGLRKHIHLNTKVIRISETDDHKESGQWFVKVKDLQNGVITSGTFDVVLVCTGVTTKPIIPDYPGLPNFQGKVLHTQQYKTSAGFEGKVVLTVGIGNSAIDAAVDISDVAKQVYASSRNGSWILGRLGPSGQPIDFSFLSRVGFFQITKLPSVVDKVIMKKCNMKIDHRLYGINPKLPPTRSSSLVNDHLPFKLLIGAIKMKPEIKEIHERGVEFVDGTKIDNIDAIVFGTGYLPDFPFLSPDIIGDASNLYLSMFPPERKNQTLATIGCFRQKGPILPVLEMQSRLATRVFKGLIKLPDRKSMWESIRRNYAETQSTRISTMKGVIQYDYVPVMDELATIIGCKPNFLKLIFQDTKLAMECIFGPATAYQFRLVGPQSWDGARDVILNQKERAYWSLHEGRGPVPLEKKRNILKSLFTIVAIATFGYGVFRYNSKLHELPALFKFK